MRGWIIALTVLGIAVAGTGALIGEQSFVATAIDWTEADFLEREAAGMLLAAEPDRASVTTADEPGSAGQVASALADPLAEAASRVEASDHDDIATAAPTQASRPPSITDETEPFEPKVAPAAEPAPIVEPAPRIIEAAPAPAPAPRPAPTQVARPLAPALAEPLAIVCMAGCGTKKIVFEAVPVAARPERVGGLVHAAVLTSAPAGPAVIECLAGCYSNTPRSYRAVEPTRTRQATHADIAYDYTTPRSTAGTSVRFQRGTRTRRQSY